MPSVFRFSGWLVLCCALSSLRPAALHAQSVELHFFDPSAAPSAALTLPSPIAPEQTALRLGGSLDYAHGLIDQAVTDSAHLDLLAAVSVNGAATLGLALPLVLTRADDLQSPARDPGTRFGVGDLRWQLVVPLLRRSWPLALGVDATFPTAGDGTFAGRHGVSIAPALLLAHPLGPVLLSGKVGYRAMRRGVLFGLEQDDALLLALGASYVLSPSLRLQAELRAELGVGGQSYANVQNPAELDLGVRFGAPTETSLVLGAGAGIWPRDSAYGAPSVRVFAAVSGVAWGQDTCSVCEADDPDHDGVPRARDACPNDPEDYDDFADADGCPDPDNDADGLLDARDQCPTRSEDSDGYEDADGCPEPDNDADGIADGADVCRFDPEDRDGYEDVDGCPEPGPGRPTVSVEGTRILVSDRIYFDDDADTIRSVSTPVLDELAKALIEIVKTKRVRVEGHTDDVGGVEYNNDLSYRRAKAVVEYLVARGVPAARLEYMGYGASRPLAPNDTPEGRALNRRVELVALDAP